LFVKTYSLRCTNSCRFGQDLAYQGYFKYASLSYPSSKLYRLNWLQAQFSSEAAQDRFLLAAHTDFFAWQLCTAHVFLPGVCSVRGRMNGSVFMAACSGRRTFACTLRVSFSRYECFIGSAKRLLILHSSNEVRTTTNSAPEGVVLN
jgi:hypothetical protein